MSALGFSGSVLVFGASLALNLVVLAYRSGSVPRVRVALDRMQRWVTGRPDWSWIRLRHLMVPLLLVTVANIAWNVATLHCSDDSLAILASGQAALHGHDPFSVTFCSGTSPDPIPYGLAEVPLNALGALSGSILGVWVVWQLLALAVVPLVWSVGGPDRRYASVLAATSILYLPNIATNIGVENAIVAVSVLVMLYALQAPRRGGTLLKGLAAFLSTARFPALFPLLGSSASLRRGRVSQTLLVLGVFLGGALLSVVLWGRDALRIVYLGQFSRSSGESLNVFALLVREGWVHPSLAVAAVQGGALLLLVLFVNVRRYSTIAACGIPLLGVMALSQYLTFHFVIWLVPLLLLGMSINGWLVVYGTAVFLDENVAYAYLGLDRGIWWPYELTGVLISALLVFLLIAIIRSEEARVHEPSERNSLPGARAQDPQCEAREEDAGNSHTAEAPAPVDP
jgi:hypothetical protein